MAFSEPPPLAQIAQATDYDLLPPGGGGRRQQSHARSIRSTSAASANPLRPLL